MQWNAGDQTPGPQAAAAAQTRTAAPAMACEPVKDGGTGRRTRNCWTGGGDEGRQPGRQSRRALK